MYVGSGHNGPMRSYPGHERHVSHGASPHPPYTHAPRPELPRPLEPRPLQPSLNDQRRQDAFRSAAPTQQEFRPQSQSLPRLHDILTSTSGPPAPNPPTYANGWGAPTAPPTNQQNNDPYYGHAGYHPPLVHPPRDYPSYQAPPPRRVDLPILETSPVARHDSHVPPPSPYYRQPDSGREYNMTPAERPRPTSVSSYPPQGAPRPYTPAGPDDQYRSPATSLDRPGSGTFAPTGPESSKKYLGIRDVPGEGAFHVYEGGYRIPTQVDGETVNPAWGLTKANKPRKRLAMACLDCREKKIKCEPGANSCLQCEKAKRPCRKYVAPAHQSQSDTATTPVWQSGAGSPNRKSASDLSPANGHEVEPDSANKRRMTEHYSPSEIPSKKHRSASPLSATNGGVSSSLSNSSYHTSPTMPRTSGTSLSWDEDPFAVDPEATLLLLDHYFQDVNNATYCMFPRHHFMHWVRSCPQKCQNERLLLYAMLAIGSIFAEDKHKYLAFGKECAYIVTVALQSLQGRFNMQVVQSRLLLGLFHFAKGANKTSWDYVGSGITAAMNLGFNTEAGCAGEEACEEKSRREFGFSAEQLVECKRRTLWSSFLMDRYCGSPTTIISPQDVFIRLPCLDDAYEHSLKSNAPHYNNGIIDPGSAMLAATSPVSPMAWLILIAAVWGDVEVFAFRSIHRLPASYAEEYEKFYEQKREDLESWVARLPEQLQFSQANVEQSIKGGYAGPYISMHSLYHLTWVKLTRFVRHALIPKSITRNIRVAHRHSRELLQVMSTLRAAKWAMADKEGHLASFSFTTPFAGYAILAAVDVVGAGGLDSNLKTTLDLISYGTECLRELARYWNSAVDQNKACDTRFYQIQNVLKHPFTAQSGCWLGREWGIDSPLEREFGLEDDCIHGADDRVYFDALKDAANGAANGNVHGIWKGQAV